MIRLFVLVVLSLVAATLLSGCGIINHQVNRAVNLLRVPVRVTDVAPAALEAGQFV
ncbi:MAG TPA: hypothetical protein PLA50_13160 [Bacteroidia bacterium]|nr:hypothetical protein [Bacteroidia bacterium]